MSRPLGISYHRKRKESMECGSSTEFHGTHSLNDKCNNVTPVASAEAASKSDLGLHY